ncbi:MAG TPA: hypothetical protein VKX17_18375 [Planctomycetota bacterium]|nr:hypothetical protein [Planctomycetota bacterium]
MTDVIHKLSLRSPKSKYHWAEIKLLARKYANLKPDLADRCRMGELFPNHSVITADSTDFKIYRRNKNQAIPIICPIP